MELETLQEKGESTRGIMAQGTRIYTCSYINSSSSEATAAFLLFLSRCFFEKTFQSPAGLIPKLIAFLCSSGQARHHCFSTSWNLHSLYEQSGPNANVL